MDIYGIKRVSSLKNNHSWVLNYTKISEPVSSPVIIDTYSK